LARKFDAVYVGHFGMNRYCERKKEEQEAMLAKLQNYPGEVMITRGGTRGSEIELCQNNINKLDSATKKNKQKSNKAYSLKRACHQISEITAFVATVFLLLFTIQLTQAMVWS
jgi:hypothetical protein